MDFFLSLFKPQTLNFIVFAYLDFIFEFQSSFSTAQNGPLRPDTSMYKFHLNCLEHSISISLTYLQKLGEKQYFI